MAGNTSIENGKLGGRPPGVKNSATLEKQLRLERIKERVNNATDVLVDAQLALARGLSYLYRIDKDEKGKNKPPILVTDQYEIESYLAGDKYEDSYYYITTEKPDNQAINSLFDRTHGRASQSIEVKTDSNIAENLTPEEVELAKQLINERRSKTISAEGEGTVSESVG